MSLRKSRSASLSIARLCIAFTTLISPAACNSTEELPSDKNPVVGIWKCTPETALTFPEGILEPVILIREDKDHHLTALGCFLWEGRYYDQWEIKEIHYSDSTASLKFTDGDNAVFEGILNRETWTIKGSVYSDDPNNEGPVDALDFMRADSALMHTLFYPRMPDAEGKVPYAYQTPEALDDGLVTASIMDKIADGNALSVLMNRITGQEYGHLESLLVIKDGNLVLEEYFFGYDRSMIHNIHSCTKSVISLLLGMSMEGHDSLNADLPLFRFFPEYEKLFTGGKRQITLKHLLTMNSGLDTEDMPDLPDSKEQIETILARPLDSEPGTQFNYCNDCSQLLGWIIDSLSGMQPDVYAAEQLFRPLGITDFFWETDNGIPHAYSDLHLLPRDMAKIGLLVLQDGQWDGKQIVPRKWILESTRPYVSESPYFEYGLYWWYRSQNDLPWWKEPGEGTLKEYDKVIALGYGGQYIFIIRDLNLVINTTASDYGNGPKARSKVPMVIEELVPLFGAPK
jgi:CubicO group peptidase (beta-lactamase class C family)